VFPGRAVANDPDRLARFSREAQLLASRNHPHIAQIHGLENSGRLHALVMELVEGLTLADRIARGGIPLDEALPIAKQIAETVRRAVPCQPFWRTYDVSPDGQRFLMIKDSAAAEQPSTPTSLVVVLKWFEELKRRLPTSGK
jgi:serine/threonine protein kinase